MNSAECASSKAAHLSGAMTGPVGPQIEHRQAVCFVGRVEEA